ncbi:MAG: hypothetical protein ACRELF_08365, partial [Gemmataceae bacterium]
MRLLNLIARALLLAILLVGCQPAARYGPRSGSETPAKKSAKKADVEKADVKPLDPEIQWIDIFNPPKPDALIDFVHIEKAPEAWSKLAKFWNELPTSKPGKTAGARTDSPTANVIQIKVPLGLPDPREYIPAGDPLTLGKWKL